MTRFVRMYFVSFSNLLLGRFGGTSPTTRTNQLQLNFAENQTRNEHHSSDTIYQEKETGWKSLTGAIVIDSSHHQHGKQAKNDDEHCLFPTHDAQFLTPFCESDPRIFIRFSFSGIYCHDRPIIVIRSHNIRNIIIHGILVRWFWINTRKSVDTVRNTVFRPNSGSDSTEREGSQFQGIVGAGAKCSCD